MEIDPTTIEYCEDCANLNESENCGVRSLTNCVRRGEPEYMLCVVVRGDEPVCPNGFKPKIACSVCKDTGIYYEQMDGGAAKATCDCPIGQQKQKEYEDAHPDTKPLTDEQRNKLTG